ncbi:MAG: hypothetical protein WCL44_09005 [bacterium]
MDGTNTLLLPHARIIADRIVERLLPHCSRIAIAGSVRRQKPTCGDIEIICVPRTVPEDGLFGPLGRVRDPEFATIVRSLGRISKGDPVAGKYIQLLSPMEVQIDLFTAQPDNWGLILAIRTGSVEYSKFLASTWCRLGFHSENGHLVRENTHERVAVSEEPDLFSMLGLKYVHPANRNL